MIEGMTEGEFLRLSERYRHKRAAQLLRLYQDNPEPRKLSLYRRVEKWMRLPPFEENHFVQMSDRYHLHLAKAGLSWKEHNLLHSPYNQADRASSESFLPLAIYLDNLRSAFNVGSILRTTEAFRLGTVCFSKATPFIDNPKVQKTSMNTCDKVPCEQHTDLSLLPRPLIALETAPEAPSAFAFEFPSSFTLLLGNEEYGLSPDSLAACDAVVQIPLYGYKNSLNVASAYAIVAGIISHQLRSKK
jgi:tRNA G18 (ribose-2'-O)-methylase SpoU